MQRNLKTLEANHIAVFAISPDSPEILRRFADKFGIRYGLLSDAGSRVIREYGVFNTHIPADHPVYGIPFPGTFMIDARGRVFDKSFIADHKVRESVNDMLQESFEVEDLERGPVQRVRTAHLAAKAYFSGPTLRRDQLVVLRVEVELEEGMHVYGRPLPEGYIPVELGLEESEDIELLEVEYPEPAAFRFELLDETLPAYEGAFCLKAQCRGGSTDQDREVRVRASLRYQACDARECYIPQVLNFELPLHFLPHNWERLE